MTVAIEVKEAGKRLSDLISRMKTGDEILLEDGSKPVARILPVVEKSGRREPGTGIGKFIVHDDFDDPLPADIMKAFEA